MRRSMSFSFQQSIISNANALDAGYSLWEGMFLFHFTLITSHTKGLRFLDHELATFCLAVEAPRSGGWLGAVPLFDTALHKSSGYSIAHSSHTMGSNINIAVVQRHLHSVGHQMASESVADLLRQLGFSVNVEEENKEAVTNIKTSLIQRFLQKEEPLLPSRRVLSATTSTTATSIKIKRF